MDYLSPVKEQWATWQNIQKKFYRRQKVYDMSWSDIDLARHVLVCAPDAGPIAVIKNDKKLLAAEPGKPTIRIFSAAGILLGVIPCDKGKIIGLSWTDRDNLLVVTEAGRFIVYTARGQILMDNSLGEDIKSDMVLECKFWGSGFIALTKRMQMVAVSDVETDPQVFKLQDPLLSGPPASWLVLLTSAGPTAIMALANGSILTVTHSSKSEIQVLTNGPFLDMAASADGKYLACFTQTGALWVVTPYFETTIQQFDMKTEVRPTQIAWCGSDCVALFWEKPGLLLIVGPGEEWIKYEYQGQSIHISPESDGLRIISNSSHEFFEKVADVTEQIFMFGSMAPGAMLFNALEQYESKQVKADENIRLLKDSLPAAVTACIDAAAKEFSAINQRLLMRAASFGKAFIEDFPPETFAEMCKVLRVLNAVRHYEVGIPITYSEFQRLTLEGLVTRLSMYSHHLLAARICKYMGRQEQAVVTQWACEKVLSSTDDALICSQIVSMLKNIPGISYAHIAGAAHRAGRTDLATRLLEFEPKAAEQVPLLLEMNREELALEKAVQCGDTDLVYLVLLSLIEHRPRDLIEVVRAWPAALDLLTIYCKQKDPERLKLLLKEFGQYQQLAYMLVRDAYKQGSIEDLVEGLQKAVSCYQVDKETAFEAKMTDDQIKLMLAQRDLEISTNEMFFGLTLSETIFKLMQMGDKRATRIKDDFKVSDKKYWGLRLKLISMMSDPAEKYGSLERLAKEKKSPIGYEPFADICIEGRVFQEAEKYIQRIQDPASRVEYWIRVSNWREAAECAFKEKSLHMLGSIVERCPPSSADSPYVQQLFAKLQSR